MIKIKLYTIIILNLISIMGFSQIIVNNGSDIVFNGASSLIINGTDIETLSDGTIHDNSTSKVFFEGNSNTEIYGTPLSLQNININNSGNLTLQTPLTINTNITFQNGDVITSNTKEINFADNATCTSASNNSHVNGPINKIGDDDFVFPLGNGSYYAPIGISGLAGNETYTAEFIFTNPTDAGYDISVKEAGIQKVSSMEYWMLSRAGAIDAYVTLYWDSNRSGGITDIADLLLCHWNAAPTPDTWENIVGSPTGTITNGSITSNSKVSNFSPFTLGSSSADNTLPITLSSFSSLQDKSKIIISWKTQIEKNNSEFILEKSSDGIHFYPIETLLGAGNSSQELLYEVVDYNPLSLNYYRLIQIDYDGKTTTSHIVSQSYSNQNLVDIRILKNNILIQNIDNYSTYKLVITNEFGRVFNSSTHRTGNNSDFTIPFAFLRGTYFITVYKHKNIIANTSLIIN